MVFHGLQKLTLLDYPGHTACTVFTGGCNYRCPFCHNALLVEHAAQQPRLEAEEVLAFLKKRQGLLDGVCITGGEPTLHGELGEFLARVHELGFATKLDTNGSQPERLRALLEQGLLDYVAMDIKTCREKYALVSGVENVDIAAVEESAALLMEGRREYEFRTTVVRELHEKADFERIGVWLSGARRYYLQAFKDSGELLCSGLSGYDAGEMENVRSVLLPHIPNTFLRGVD